MSIAYEHSVEVQCSVNQAFDLIDDLPRTPEWLGPCTKLENVTSKSGNSVGDKLKYSYKQGGQAGVMDGEIVTLDRDRRHVCRYYDKMFEVVVDLRVSSHGNGCRLTHLITMTPKTFIGRMMSPLIRMGLKKQTVDAMNSLKTLLEV